LGEDVRVIHIVTRYLHGGSERDIEAWMRAELDHEATVTLLCGRASEVRLVPLGVTVEVLDSLVRRPSPRDALAYRALRRIIRDGGYDVVVTHQSKAGVLGRLAARGQAARVVHAVHMPSFGPGYGKLESAIFRWAERFCARHTDRFIAVGRDIQRRYVAGGVGRDELFDIVRTPIELDRFIALRSRRAELSGRIRRQLGVPSNVAVLTCIGSLEARKRTSLAINGVGPLLRDGSAILVVVGSGPEERVLREQVERMGVGEAVFFFGHVDDPGVVLAAADVVVHASAVEGVCRVFVEAAACGTPVVATDVDGASEVPGVRIVDRAGVGLASAVRETLRSKVEEVDERLLSEWNAEDVVRQFTRVHERLATVG
jgi:glycosyltransferase involved in cell wall biosynthesis